MTGMPLISGKSYIGEIVQFFQTDVWFQLGVALGICIVYRCLLDWRDWPGPDVNFKM